MTPEQRRQQSQVLFLLEHRWFFPLLDAVLAFAAFGLSYIGRYELQILRPVSEFNFAPFSPYLPYAAVFIPLLLINYRSAGLYKSVRGRAWLEEIYIIANGAASASVVLMALSFVFQPLVFSRLMLVYVGIVTTASLSLTRLIRRFIEARLRSQGIGVERVLVIGAGEVGMAVLRSMIARPELGYHPVGYLDDNPERGMVDLGRVKGLGALDNLEEVIRTEQVDLVMLTLSWDNRERIMTLMRLSRSAGAQVRVVPDAFQLNLRQVQVENLDGIPLLRIDGHTPFRGTNRLIKRALDVGVVLAALPFLLVIFALIALAIRLQGGGPVIYQQRRVGENGREFYLLKFRTMIDNADKMHKELVEAAGEDPRHPKLKNDPRVTKIGRFLRTTSLDELPNLLNVLRGQMSLVGPRPPTPDEVELYEPWHLQRLQILPGITGLWQISGRSDIPFEEMCLLDIYYIENWSVKMDAQILLMTIPRVLLGSGAY
ncbi:MAG: sugar transferase [Chloroflexi bacterium]|nr:MAG: sugar transferase [Chloroflexota bacterium]